MQYSVKGKFGKTEILLQQLRKIHYKDTIKLNEIIVSSSTFKYYCE